MSGLVASAQYDYSAQFGEAIPIWRGIIEVGDSAEKGDWAGELAGGMSIAADVVATAIDPIAALGSSVASFLMDKISFLHEGLELLTGSPEEVHAMAATWTNIANALTDSAAELKDEASGLLAQWEGEGADAYGKALDALGEALAGSVGSAKGLSGGLEIAAMIVQLVYEIVKSIIADCVGQLISWVTEALATLGFGIPLIAAQASSKIGKYATKVAEWIDKISSAISRFQRIVDDLNALWSKGIPFIYEATHSLGRAGRPLIEVSISGLIDVGGKVVEGLWGKEDGVLT